MFLVNGQQLGLPQSGKWRTRQDSNLQPSGSKPDILSS